LPKVKAKWNLVLAVLLMVAFALTRWPGLLPNNFSAAYALAFCAGAFFPRGLAWWLPLGTLFLTDVALSWYYGASLATWRMLGNYVAYGLLILLGGRFSRRARFLNLVGGGLLGAVIFYLVTNTFSWLCDPAYRKDRAGWLQALTVGVPGFPPTWEFFRNTLLSGGLFTGLFAGAMKLGEASEPAEQEAEEPEEEPEEAEPEEAKA